MTTDAGTRPAVGPPRGVLRGGAVGTGRVHHQRIAPASELAGSVAHFWTVSWDLRECAPHLVETLPHPSVHLIFEGRRARVAGVTTGRFSRRLRGHGSVFGIKFRPAAFQPLYNGDVAVLTDRVVPIRALFGAAGTRLARALGSEPGFEGRVELAEAFLAERVMPLPQGAARMRDLVERMSVDRELVQVEQVAAQAGLSVRALQRLFRTYVGVNPKWVLGRYRLHEAAAQLEEKQVDLSGLAFRLGYFDQAHFIRDFKAMTRRTPGQYARAAPTRRRGDHRSAAGADPE